MPSVATWLNPGQEAFLNKKTAGDFLSGGFGVIHQLIAIDPSIESIAEFKNHGTALITAGTIDNVYIITTFTNRDRGILVWWKI